MKHVQTFRLVLLTACLALFASTASLAQESSPCAICQWRYFSTNFNGFVFGDYTAYGGDCEAYLAVGGTFKVVNGYSVGYPVVGEPLPTFTNGTTDMLIIGNDFYDNNNFGVNGNIVYGGTHYSNCTRYPTVASNLVYHATNITFDAAGNVSRDGTGKTWAELYAIAKAASAQMAAFEDCGVVTKTFTQYHINLKGTNQSFNVFNVNAADWSKTSAGYTIEAPEGSTVLINIRGSAVAITNGSMTLVGVDTNHVVFNYIDATTITTKSFAHNGSLLAPYASGILSGGSVNGYAVFGGDVEGSIGFEFHNFPFKGRCCDRDSHTSCPCTIGRCVWLDLNGDCIQDPDEVGMANVTVLLLDASSNVLETAVTDANGYYLFTDIQPASYRVQVVPPPQYVFTVRDAASTNDVYDSDIDANGFTPLMTLANGATNLSANAGLIAGARIYGHAYWDINTDLLRTTSVDYPISEMTVTLWRDGQLVASTVTSADGKGLYEFNNLAPGDYTIRFDGDKTMLSAVPSGSTDPERNRATVDEEETIAIPVTVAAGEGVLTGTEPRNAGFLPPERPLSDSVAFRAYSASDGARVEFTTAGELGDGMITAEVWLNGEWVELGSTFAVGWGSNTYSFDAPMLTPGERYCFRVRDEVGYEYELYGVEVTPFAMEMQMMDRTAVSLTWEAIPGREYEVYSTTQLGGGWTLLETVWADDEHPRLKVKIDPEEPQRFFKIVMKRDDVIE